ncbi:hypothetical protein LIER_40225 [Lithospermum erythrorhizon]|uniref:Uncharacterized protein n=1 Tax=Lithospermum erythrorhizon TaxID=34254 RepID=A0AAV3QRG8_LITER
MRDYGRQQRRRRTHNCNVIDIDKKIDERVGSAEGLFKTMEIFVEITHIGRKIKDRTHRDKGYRGLVLGVMVGGFSDVDGGICVIGFVTVGWMGDGSRELENWEVRWGYARILGDGLEKSKLLGIRVGEMDERSL